jgi:hypothetical protein
MSHKKNCSPLVDMHLNSQQVWPATRDVNPRRYHEIDPYENKAEIQQELERVDHYVNGQLGVRNFEKKEMFVTP